MGRRTLHCACRTSVDRFSFACYTDIVFKVAALRRYTVCCVQIARQRFGNHSLLLRSWYAAWLSFRLMTLTVSMYNSLMNLLTVTNISKQYSERLLFDGASMLINEGDRIGLIGVNGSGKSTLLRLVASLETPDSGGVTVWGGCDG